jgi:hypothetical protein
VSFRSILTLALIINAFQLPAHNAVNRITLEFMRKLLNSANYHTIAYELNTASDIELLLDFILCVRRCTRVIILAKPFSNSYSATVAWLMLTFQMQIKERGD